MRCGGGPARLLGYNKHGLIDDKLTLEELKKGENA